MLNQLLGKHLYALGLRYTGPPARRNYFPRPNDSDTEFAVNWYNVRTKRRSRARLVVKHYRYGPDDFWRHSAANLRFRNYGANWYLEVIPRYHFTADGEQPFDPERVGSLTTKVKSMERNLHVLNQVLFWADSLSPGESAIQLKLEGRLLVKIVKEPETAIVPFSIPYDPAVLDDEDVPVQERLFGDPALADEDGEYDEFYI